MNYARGGFRYSSGRDTEPGSTEVEIQESGVTMGVRGTVFDVLATGWRVYLAVDAIGARHVLLGNLPPPCKERLE